MRQERRNVYNGYTEKKECKSFMFDGKLTPCAHLYDNPKSTGIPFLPRLENTLTILHSGILLCYPGDEGPVTRRYMMMMLQAVCQSHTILRDHSCVRGLCAGWRVSAGQGSSAQCLCTRAQVIVNTTCTGAQVTVNTTCTSPTPHTFPSKITNDLALTENSKIWKRI